MLTCEDLRYGQVETTNNGFLWLSNNLERGYVLSKQLSKRSFESGDQFSEAAKVKHRVVWGTNVAQARLRAKVDI